MKRNKETYFLPLNYCIELKDKDYFFMQLYNRVKPEVEWMFTYIGTYNEKYAIAKPKNCVQITPKQ